MTFFNTNLTKQHQLHLEVKSTDVQDKLVLEQMRIFKKATASMIWEQLIAKRYISAMTPLQSIRRAMSTFKRNGLFEITDETRPGYYKRNERFYKLI